MNRSPITPERILNEMRSAGLVSQISIPVSGQRFKEFLQKPDFRAQAMEIVQGKLDAINNGEITFAPGPNTTVMATRSWKTLLQKIKDADSALPLPSRGDRSPS